MRISTNLTPKQKICLCRSGIIALGLLFAYVLGLLSVAAEICSTFVYITLAAILLEILLYSVFSAMINFHTIKLRIRYSKILPLDKEGLSHYHIHTIIDYVRMIDETTRRTFLLGVKDLYICRPLSRKKAKKIIEGMKLHFSKDEFDYSSELIRMQYYRYSGRRWTEEQVMEAYLISPHIKSLYAHLGWKTINSIF